MLKRGQQAPAFELESMEGRSISLKEILAAGPAVVAFFKISCPVCQFTFPFLERIHQATNGSGLRIHGVSQDGASATEFFLKDQGISFPALLDPHGQGYPVSNGYEIRTVPTVVVIEQDGAIASVIEGFDRAGLEELGRRAGISTFKGDEDIPAFRPG